MVIDLNLNINPIQMKFKYLFASCLLGSGLLTGCVDDFADLNSNPGDITKPNIRFLFTECLRNVEPMDYAAWHYDYYRTSTWTQTTVMNGGNSDNMNIVTEQGSTGYHVNRLLRMTNEVRYQISLMSGDEKEKHEYIQYLLNPLLVMIGMNDSDYFGNRQYSEAEQARYTNPPIFKPKYDTQEELFDIWLNELNATIDYLTKNKITDVLGTQDFIYNGNIQKWAKLANSMKLKLAARMIHTNKDKALTIVKEVVESPAGVIGEGDDLIFNKGKYDNHWNNDINVGIAADQLIEFMKENKDTRLLSVFEKNQFNGPVVQAFLDQKKELPPYIKEYIITEEKEGKTVFTGWKAPGEPWVRYYGAPIEIGASTNNDYKWIFNPSGDLFTLKTANGSDKKYTPLSYRNTEMIKMIDNFTYPDAPDVTPDKDIERVGWSGLYFSAGEVNLLLAEFQLLGAAVPNSAQNYLSEGVRLSALAYDKIAELNKVPYYFRVSANDPLDKSIKVNESMLQEMLSTEAVQLNGDVKANLEKVYIQQYIHYIMSPMDQFVNVRRSGVPMKNSEILPWVEFDKKMDMSSYIPRRGRVMAPTQTDIMYDITVQTYKDQGFTYGTDSDNPSLLNSERIWYDKNAPQFGAGPQL